MLSQANVKQHPEDEFLLFENYSHFSSCYHPKIMVHILKTKQNKKYVSNSEDKNVK